MAITKSCISMTDWTAVAQNTIAESAEIDLSDVYEAILHIQAALDTTTAHTGTKFIVQISGSATGDENWQDFTEFVELIGTAGEDAIENSPLAAGETAIHLAAHAYGTEGVWLFIEDGTIANSEVCFEKSFSAGTVNILDGVTNAHVATTKMYDISFTKNLLLPPSAKRARVIVDNTYDDNGSTLNYKVRATKVTAV